MGLFIFVSISCKKLDPKKSIFWDFIVGKQYFGSNLWHNAEPEKILSAVTEAVKVTVYQKIRQR
jgi:hypothetical protein